MNYYELLNLQTNATPQEIKVNYRKEALKWHPDKNSDKEAPERFKLISVAYQTLSNGN
jgi:curved DNA-binding protein CbpA